MITKWNMHTSGEGSDDRPKTLVEDAYLRLREDIIQGKYESGARLRVEHLKNDYGVGAGTLREALSLLVADALVTTEGQRGFSVAPLSLADLDDLTHTRILLETDALRQSLRNGGDDWEAGLVAAFHRLTKVEGRMSKAEPLVKEWESCNKGFHEALIGACRSRWLPYLLALLYRQTERYRRFNLTKGFARRNVHAEHSEIFDAAMRRDGEQACEVLARHIDLTRQTVHEMAPDWLRQSG